MDTYNDNDDTIKENVEDLISHLTEYAETQKELFVLHVQEKAALAVSETVVWLVATFLGFFAVTFLSVALAVWVGRMLENSIQGFLLVGILYGLLAILFFVFRKAIIQEWLSNVLLNKFITHE